MDALLPQFEPIKDKIPEFVIKLYHILQQRQFSEYLSWHGDTQILIKHPKKFEDKVLPHFFRHRHLSSFIRQLNMYKFNKVVKLIKEKNYMYFKNEHFKRGQVANLVNIKRNAKKSRKENLSLQTISDGQKEENISIDVELQKNTALMDYKHYVKGKMMEVALLLKKMQGSHPQIKDQLGQAIIKCNELVETEERISQNEMLNIQESNYETDNMLLSMRLMNVQPMLFASQCNF